MFTNHADQPFECKWKKSFLDFWSDKKFLTRNAQEMFTTF